MNIKDYLELKGYVLTHRKDDEYSCSCPMCGGDDRFHLWTNDDRGGRWACRQGLGDHIGQRLSDGFALGGDFLDLYQHLENVSFTEAKKALGLDSLLEKTNIKKTQSKQEKPYADDKPKNDTWINQAKTFVDEKAENLLNDKTKDWGGLSCLDWLKEKRCLTEKTIRRFKLGLTLKYEEQPYNLWGLKPGERDKVVFFKQNLIIPTWRRGGYIDKIKVRFSKASEKTGQRYKTLGGSNDAPSVYGKPSNVYVVVESELDAILLAQECSNICPICLSGVGKKPTESLAKEIMKADVLLLCLDSDNPGKENLKYWQEHFKNSYCWRIPSDYGKDPTDLEYNYRQGKCPISLARFIEFGIERATAKEQPTEQPKPIEQTKPIEQKPMEQKRELSQEEVEAITNKLDEVLSNAVKTADSMSKENQNYLTSLMDRVDPLCKDGNKKELAVVLTRIQDLTNQVKGDRKL